MIMASLFVVGWAVSLFNNNEYEIRFRNIKASEDHVWLS